MRASLSVSSVVCLELDSNVCNRIESHPLSIEGSGVMGSEILLRLSLRSVFGDFCLRFGTAQISSVCWDECVHRLKEEPP